MAEHRVPRSDETIRGIYCLLIAVPRDLCRRVGSLGVVHFKKGRYVYVGSAQNNLRKRVTRHFARDKKRHWHIDHLLNAPGVRLLAAYHRPGDRKAECRAARQLMASAEPVPRFGCSDCVCGSHLFRVPSADIVRELGMAPLGEAE